MKAKWKCPNCGMVWQNNFVKVIEDCPCCGSKPIEVNEVIK